MDLMMNEMTGGYKYVVRDGNENYDPVNLEDNYYFNCIECKNDKKFSAFGCNPVEVCKECCKENINWERNRWIKRRLKELGNEAKVEGNYYIIEIPRWLPYYHDEKYLYKFQNGRWRKVMKGF